MLKTPTLNQYFKLSEFECQCGCGYAQVDPDLLMILTTVREHFNKPITVTSGCRCAKHNAAIGGAPKSFHITGHAADIKVKDVEPMEVYEFLKEQFPQQFGFIKYVRWVHVDSRQTPYRKVQS